MYLADLSVCVTKFIPTPSYIILMPTQPILKSVFSHAFYYTNLYIEILEVLTVRNANSKLQITPRIYLRFFHESKLFFNARNVFFKVITDNSYY